MKIYNEDMTKILNEKDIDLVSGYLKADTIEIGMAKEIKEEGHYEYGEPDEKGVRTAIYMIDILPKIAEPILENINIYIPYMQE